MSSAPQARAQAAFAVRFGAPPACVAAAPGRVNLIGEHTDYNDGFVLPCALPFHTVVAARARPDRTVQVLALDSADSADGEDAFALDHPPVAGGKGDWRDYVRGMLLALDQARRLPAGLDLVITGDVPQGAGLSSSAALMVALGTVVRGLYDWPADPVGVARLAQQAENQYVGCQCGIMDQLASACGAAGHAVLLDCRSLATRLVPLPASHQLMILHSRVRRGLVDSAYNERRRQCATAASHYGVTALRDLGLAELAAGQRGLDPLAFRRARHVVSENARVLAAEQALQAGDLRRMGQLMADSHRSMRDDFAITVPAIDHLVALVDEVLAGDGGARMTGGGFGGCVVALVPAVAVAEVSRHVAAQYRSPDGEPAHQYRCEAGPGARLVTDPAPAPLPEHQPGLHHRPPEEQP